MASSSSTQQINNTRAQMEFKPVIIPFTEDELEIIQDSVIDFQSLAITEEDADFNVLPLFEAQGWTNYFKMLNGPVYNSLVKHFWLRAEVFDEKSAHEELEQHYIEDESRRGKTRKQLGLPEFKGTEIRSSLCGVKLILKEETIEKLIQVKSTGVWAGKLKKNTYSNYADTVSQNLFRGEAETYKNLSKSDKLIFKILISSIFPRAGNKDQISYDHKYFMY